MNKKWSEKSIAEKALDIISAIALCVWFVFERLEDKNTVSYAGTGSYIAIFVICVCQAISFWKVKRSLSYAAIAGSVFMIAVAVLNAMLNMN